MVLEDLTVRGYSVENQQLGLNLEQSKMAIEKMAFMHAASVVLLAEVIENLLLENFVVIVYNYDPFCIFAVHTDHHYMGNNNFRFLFLEFLCRAMPGVFSQTNVADRFSNSHQNRGPHVKH